MRALAVLFTLAGSMLPAYGAKSVTVAEPEQTSTAAAGANALAPVSVAQLEQTIVGSRSLPDSRLAEKLSGLQLTQRLSASTLARLMSTLSGPQSRQELSILAAQSSFLELPPSEIPSTAAPDVSQQRRIMAAVVAYVTQTVKKLPDFIATRDTRTFEDRPAGAYSYLPLRLINQVSATVVYRDGQERDSNGKGKKIDTGVGLVSWGEFGPILTTVLLDAAKSQLAWSHWEQDAGGAMAVFRYAVPAKASHYQLQFCCEADSGILVATDLEGHLYHWQAAYHGEIAIDPSTGAIHRITVVADHGSDDPLVTASIAVQYGLVDIGGKTYNCPIRSEAIAQNHRVENREGTIPSTAISQGPILTRLNEVTFKEYRLFRGDSRILTDAELARMTGQPAEQADTNAPAPPTESQLAAQTAQSTGESAHSPARITVAPAPSPSTPPAAPVAAPPEPAAGPASSTQSQTEVTASAPPQSGTEYATIAANTVNTANTSGPADTAGIPVFRTTARQVLVDVVIDRKNGDPVAGLPQSDFTIEEDGKLQTIDFFEEHSANGSALATTPVMPSLPAGAVTNVPATPPTGALYVFLLDSLNTEPQDQVNVRQQVLSYLHKMDPGTQVAVFGLGSHLRLLRGFTSDPAALLAAISGKGAEREAMAQNRSDNADDAEHIATLQTMRSQGVGALQAAQANANAYSFGARASMTFEALNALARYLEGIPGRKNLIWFSSSFPVVFFPTPSEMERLKNNPNLPGYMNHVQQTANLFTLSKIAVYPVSGAGVASSNVGLADSAGSGRAGGSNGTGSLAAESLNSASALAGMEQLASSTGGRAFTTNDIAAALRSIVHESDIYYTVGYSPSDSAEDSGFRRIDVKVNGGKYRLAYRKGYNADSVSTQGEPQGNPLAPLLQPGMPSASGILFGISIASAPAQSAPAEQNSELKGPLTRYTVSFTIRAQDVSFSEAPNGGRIAKLLIGVKAYGNDGAALNWQANRVAAEFTAAQYASLIKTGFPVSVDLDLPASTPAQLVTAVYDWNTTRSGTLEISLHP